MLRIITVVGIGLLIGLAGCDAKYHRRDEAGRILFENTAVKDCVRVIQQDSDRIEGGLLRVRTILKCKKKEDIFVDVKTVWKDAKGYALYETSWAPFLLTAREPKTLEVVSMRADVADYELRVRQAKKTESTKND